MFNGNKKGFTLAEILITLSIVGVIASMTIPGLVYDIQYQQYKTAWKKAFANITLATMRVRTANGGSLKGLCDDFDDNCFKDKYLPYLNYTKSCNVGYLFGPGNCWYNTVKYLNGKNHTFTNTPPQWSGAILADGSILWFGWWYKACRDDYYNPPWAACGGMTVDTNGWKGPNTYGKDIFQIYLYEDRVDPDGSTDSIYTTYTPSDCIAGDPNSYGFSCAAEYLK